MSAKILAFDLNRKVPARHYTPIALRGRILYMPPRPAQNNEVSDGGMQTTVSVQEVQELQTVARTVGKS